MAFIAGLGGWSGICARNIEPMTSTNAANWSEDISASISGERSANSVSASGLLRFDFDAVLPPSLLPES